MAKPNCFVKRGFARCESIVLVRFVGRQSMAARADRSCGLRSVEDRKTSNSGTLRTTDSSVRVVPEGD
jgi:hypothetical protein